MKYWVEHPGWADDGSLLSPLEFINKTQTYRKESISTDHKFRYFLYICLSKMRFVRSVKCEFSFSFFSFKKKMRGKKDGCRGTHHCTCNQLKV